MTFRYGVSLAALAVAAFGSGAQAQTVNTTPSDAHILNLLSPFLTLNTGSVGQQTLQINLSQAAAINTGADQAQQQRAISDKALLGAATVSLASVGLGTYGVAAHLAGSGAGAPAGAAGARGPRRRAEMLAAEKILRRLEELDKDADVRRALRGLG